MGSDEGGSDGRAGTAKARVLLLVDASDQRAGIASWLSRDHAIVEPADEPLACEFDLCLLDDGAYARLRPWIGQRKRTGEASFLPFVLLASRPLPQAYAEDPGPDLDEVLRAPVTRDELLSRLDILLTRRGREERLRLERDEAARGLRAAEEDASRELEATRALVDAASLTAAPDLAAVLDRIVGHVSERLGRDRVMLYLFEGDGTLRAKANRGGFVHAVGETHRVADHSREIRDATYSRTPVVVDFHSEGLSEEAAREHERFKAEIILYVPLLVQGRHIGTLTIDDPGVYRPFSDRDIELASGLAAHAGVAIENARLLRAERIARQEADDAIRYAPAAIYEIDLSSRRFLRVNDAMVEMSGYSREELLTMDPFTLLDEPGRALFHRRIATALAGTPLTDDVEYRGFRKDGAEIFASLTVRKSRVDGTCTRLFVVGQNVTARRQAEKAERHARMEADRELRRTETLLRAAAALGERLELDAVLDALAETVLEAVPHSRVRISLFEDDHLRIAASKGSDPLPVGTLLPVSEAAAPVRAVVTERSSAVIDFDALSPEERRYAERFDSHVMFMAPIMHGARVLGFIGVDDPGERRDFPERETELVEGIAHQAALALENARLYEEERRSNVRLRTLGEIDELMISSLDSQQIIGRALEAVERHLGVTASTVWTLDAESRRLHVLGVRGFSERFATEFRDGVDLDDAFPVARAARTGEPVLIEQAGAGTVHAPVRAAYANAGLALGSLAAVPLIARGEVIGGLTLAWDRERRFGTEEPAFIAAIASRFSNSIENARLFEVERERARLGGSMLDINARLASSLDIDETLSAVLERVSGELQCQGLAVTDRVPGGWHVRHTAGLAGPGLAPGFRLPDDRAPVAMRVLATLEPHLVADVARRDDGFTGTSDMGCRAFATYPLIVRGELTGVLTAFFDEPRELSELERDYLQRVAFAISVTEENSRLYMAEHMIADRLQEALLALPEHVPGIEFAHAYHAAADAARVGGDFYDVFELSHDHVGVLIGDVAGKGLNAAVVTSMVKNTIRAHANERGKTPARILGLTNEVVYKATPTEAFVTLFLGILDCRDGRLVYSNAGHTTAVVVTGDGTARRLPVTGPLLGAYGDIGFEQAETRLNVGELLFLYTDGLTEAQADGTLYGEDRLFGFLTASAEGSAQEVVRSVIGDALAFSREPLRDDLAILAMRRVEQDSEAPHQQKLEV